MMGTNGDWLKFIAVIVLVGFLTIRDCEFVSEYICNHVYVSWKGGAR